MVLWDDITDEGTSTLVGSALAFDTFAQLVTIIICASVVLVALLTEDELRQRGEDGPEVYALYLVVAAGGVVMGAANDLIVLFLGLETLSLGLYVLAASDRRRAETRRQGAIKRAGSSAALHMPQRGHAQLEPEGVLVLGEVAGHRGRIVSRAFRDHRDCVRLAAFIRLPELHGHLVGLHLCFWNDDDFGSAGQASHERKIAAVAAHHFHQECSAVG